MVVYRGNRRYAASYTELARLAGRFSAELASRGIAPGERVVIWGENSVEWVAAFFGCLLRGVIAVPLDLAGSTEFAQRVIADVTPELVVGDPMLLGGLKGGPSLLQFSAFDASLPAAPLFDVEAMVSETTPLQIVFTSGTTSEPKGIVHTHRNVLASLRPIEREIDKYLKYERYVHPLRFLHSLPLSHVFGQFMGLWVPPLLAAEVHFESQLEPARLVAAIRRERISVLAAVPRVLQLLRAHLLARDPKLRDALAAAKGEPAWKHWWRFRRLHRDFGLKFWAVVCGGASLPAELEEFWNTLGFALIQGYGLTETAALVTLNHPFKIGKGTIGKPLPGREVRLAENGEIQVRGEMLSTETWQGGRLRKRENEWLATGDLAAQEASGELRFVGRASDVIVSPSGMNIHAADLEAAFSRQAGVQACAVVACPAMGGMEPVAVAIFSGSEEELAVAVRDANRGLAEHQWIHRWLRWPELTFPYTSTGKLLRRKIAEWACATQAGQRIAGAQEEHADALLAMVAAIVGDVPAKVTDASLLAEDLRLDSLGRVQLQSAIEQRLGIELPEDAMERVGSLGDLRALIRRSALDAGSGAASYDGGVYPAAATKPVDAVALRDKASRDADHAFPHWPWWPPVQGPRVVFIEGVMRPLVWLLAAPRVVRPRLELPDGPLLLIANHVTSYDAALVLYALPRKLRDRAAVAMSGELLMDFRRGRRQGNFVLDRLAPAAYWLMTALFNVFPLPRSSGFRRSFAHAGEAMDRGYSVLVFPEGHRSADGRLQPFRPGIGLLAVQSRVAVLPIVLEGLGELKRERKKWFRSGKLTIRVGDVIVVGDATDAAAVTRLLEETFRTICAAQIL